MAPGTFTLFIIAWLLLGFIGVMINWQEDRKMNLCIIVFIIIALFLPEIAKLLRFY